MRSSFLFCVIMFILFSSTQAKTLFLKQESIYLSYLERAEFLESKKVKIDSIKFLANSALEHYTTKSDTLKIARCYSLIIFANLYTGEIKVNFQILEQFATYLTSLNEKDQINHNFFLKYYWYLGWNNYAAGKNKAVIAHYEKYEKELSFYEENNDNYLLVAKNYLMYSSALRNLSLLDKALSICLKALKIAPNKFKDSIYTQIGGIYFLLGMREKGFEIYQKNLDLVLKLFGENHIKVKYQYLNFAWYYHYIGDYEKAIFYVKKTEIPKIKEPQYFLLILYYEQLASFYDKINDYKNAIENYHITIDVYENKFNGIHPELIRLYHIIGNLYFGINDYKNSNVYLQKALRIGELLKEKVPKEQIITSYLRLTRLNQAINNNFEVKKYLNKAIKLESEMEFREVSDAYFQFGLAFEQLHDYLKAVEYFNKSLYYYANNGQYEKENKNYYLIPEKLEGYHFLRVVQSIVNKANNLKELYKINKEVETLFAAIKHYKEAIKLIENKRNEFNFQKDKRFLLDRLYNSCINGFKSSYELSEKIGDKNLAIQNAFYFSEEAKNITLKEKILSESFLKIAKLPKKLLRNVSETKGKLEFYKKKRSELSSSDSTTQKHFINQVILYEQKYDSLIQALERNHPKYYELKYNNEIIDLSTIQNNLSKNETLLEYQVSDNGVYIFVINKKDYSLTKIPLKNELGEKIEYFRKSLLEKKEENYLNLGYDLYRVLIEPIEDKIKGKKLLIIPDSYLGYLPYEVLLTKKIEASEIDYKDLPYLIKDYQIRYQYSATIALKTQNPIGDYNNKKDHLLAFAPNFKEKDDLNTELSSYNDTIRGNLIELPGAANEVKVINSIFDGSVYINDFATERKFREQANSHSILHLATHAIVDDENPSKSKLLFSLNDTIDDGYLHAYELYGMNINAELVTLSACNTGYGKIKKGEGVMSLARGFAYAGCPNLVMSLWPASDRSTSNLMKLFYENLSEGMKKDEALYKAKLSYIHESSNLMAHPYYWGSFIFVGNNKPITEKSQLFKWFVGVPLFIIFLIIIYLKKGNRA